MDRKEGVDNDCVARAILLDLTKAIDYIPHYLIIAKMAANGLNSNAFKLIFPTVKKQHPTFLKFHKLILENLPSLPFSVTPLKIDHFTLNPIPHRMLPRTPISLAILLLYFQNYY